MYFVFRGKRYRLRYVPAMRDYGRCDHPNSKKKEILIREGQSPKDLLNTLLHEGLHACTWDMAEEAVASTADSLTDFLWRLGYRKVK